MRATPATSVWTYTRFNEVLISRMASQNGEDMRFWARSVYTTEYLRGIVDTCEVCGESTVHAVA